ncbi:MAG: MerR family transcriptional regulator [Pseudomonadota bacterium]
MKRLRTYQVRDIARISGVTVRTLHHYDAIGLLRPASRTEAGYRLYDDDSLVRLQQILIQRALGLSLEEIRSVLDDPDYDRRLALLRQRADLVRRAQDAERLIRSVDRALAFLDSPQSMESIDMKTLFDGFDPEDFEDETKERWGGTAAYNEATARTKAYTADDWAAIKAETDAIYDDLAAAMQKGLTEDHPEVAAIVERHRRLIDQRFYPCDLNALKGLADLYDADPRYAKTIDKHGQGLARFLSRAIRVLPS